MKSFRPVLWLFALPAMAVMLAPGLRDSLLYSRENILHGEWWRLWTCHWVHFSGSHLAWNLVVLFGAGAWLERRQHGLLLTYTLIGAPLISLTLLFGEPAMQTYGGLSGIATGVVVLLALTELGRRDADRAWWWGLLLLVAAKIVFDATQTSTLFAGFGAQVVRSSVLAHAAGAMAALALILARPIHPQLVPDQPSPSKLHEHPTQTPPFDRPGLARRDFSLPRPRLLVRRRAHRHL